MSVRAATQCMDGTRLFRQVLSSRTGGPNLLVGHFWQPHWHGDISSRPAPRMQRGVVIAAERVASNGERGKRSQYGCCSNPSSGTPFRIDRRKTDSESPLDRVSPNRVAAMPGVTHRTRSLSENESQKREVDEVVGKSVNPVTYRLEVADYPVSTDAKTLSAAF